MQAFLHKISLNEPGNQQIAAIGLAVLMGAILLFCIGYSWAKVAFAPEDTRDYRYIPFDMYDATQLCTAEMDERLGSRLLRYYVDQHSTRLDNRQGMYRVYLKADVGNLREYNEVDVYCYIDKWDHTLDYYKEIDPTKKGIMTTDLEFFKN